MKHHWEYPTHAFERVHIDFAGKFLGTYFFLLIDAFSKWPEIYTLDKIDTDSTIEILEDIFARFGYPRVLVSDNGGQFTNSKFATFLKQRHIIHKRSAPYHPATNGQAERLVQILKNKLKTLRCDRNNIQENLKLLLQRYRITPHSMTNKSPAELMLSYPVRSKLSLMVPNTESENKVHEYNHKPCKELEIGSRVIARNYTGMKKWKFGSITNKLGELHYEIQLDSGEKWRRHLNQLRQVGSQIPQQLEHSFEDFVMSEEKMPEKNLITNNDQLNYNHEEASPSVIEQGSDHVSNSKLINENNDCVISNDSSPLVDNGNTASAPSSRPLRRSERVRKKVDRLDL